MRATIIQQSPDFVLTSYGNGWAYELRNTADALSVFLQDDDALAFREELESFEKHRPHEDSLAYMWEIYSSVATEC